MKKILKEEKNFIISIVAVTMIALFMIGYFLNSYQKNVNEYIEYQNRIFINAQQNTISSYENFSNFIFTAIVNDGKILKNMNEVNDLDASDVAKEEEIREELYGQLKKYYDISTEYDFKQMQFHLPNGESFLRFNNPSKYGDNLMDVRESIRIANQEKKYVSGFEGGKIFNGYRFVYPLNYEEEHIGSVEVSVSMASVLKVLQDLYPERLFSFILEKDLINNTVFQEERFRYSPSITSDDYLVEDDILLFLMENEFYRDISEDENFNKKFKSKSKGYLEKKDSFSFFMEQNDLEYMVQFLSIKNIKEEPVAYLISMAKDDQVHILTTSKNTNLLLVSLLYLLIVLLILLTRNRQKRMYFLAHQDPLTKAYNRYAFFELVENELGKNGKKEKSISFAFLDVDFFKNINDTYGHVVGDLVLKEVVSIVNKKLRRKDILARYGGDEFIFMFPDTSIEEGCKIVEEIRWDIENHHFINHIKVTISAGCTKRNDGENIDQIIEKVDRALYLAKKDGRNKVRVIDQ